jgi:Cof subfamily protein (haloacid dehalogenase superfamily)
MDILEISLFCGYHYAMSAVKLLAIDLDDTLLRCDLTISYRTRNAVKKAEEAGVNVVLASGRVPAAVEPFAKTLGLHRRNGYLICSNGTVITETIAGNVVHERKIEGRAALAAFDLADAEDFPVQIYDGDVLYVSRSNEYSEYDQKLTGLRQIVPDNFREMVAGGCYKLLIPGDPVLLAPLEKLLYAYLGENITLFTSKPYFLEVLPAHTDKGSALAKVAEFLGINREEVLAIGDSMNDEAMLRWAGTGVAMLNGDERIKAAADIVSERSNDDDGVADIIEKYVLAKSGST